MKAFHHLSEKLGQRGTKGEIGIVGGAAMVLAFNARAATKDVDAIFKPASEIREAAKEVALKLKLPEDWLNDAVKGYLPGAPKAKRILFAEDHLSVWVPEAEYLLAMKSISARFDSADSHDIAVLIKHLGLKDPDAALNVVEAYYPRERVPPKTRFFIEELFENIESKPNKKPKR